VHRSLLQNLVLLYCVHQTLVAVFSTANISNQESDMKLLFQNMNKTADDAVGKMFATRKANISGFHRLYCLALCTLDLSTSVCRRCLSGVIGDLPWSCQGKQGGRVLYPSCNVRYDLYPFYRSNKILLHQFGFLHQNLDMKIQDFQKIQLI